MSSYCYLIQIFQANVTSQILARIYNKSKEYQNIVCITRSKDIIKKIKNKYILLQVDKFLTKSIKQEVQFTAYGFFVIDKSTIFKVNVIN